MPYRQLTNNDNDISCLRGVVFRNLHTYIIVLGQALSHKITKINLVNTVETKTDTNNCNGLFSENTTSTNRE